MSDIGQKAEKYAAIFDCLEDPAKHAIAQGSYEAGYQAGLDSVWVSVETCLPDYNRDFNFISKCKCVESAKIDNANKETPFDMTEFFSDEGYARGSTHWCYISLPKPPN